VPQDPRARALGDDRAELGLGECRVADADLPRLLRQPLDDLVVDAALDEQSAAGDAGLPRADVSTGVSSKTSTGDLPPSSRVALANRPAAAREIARPTSVPPVKTTFLTRGCSASAAPATAPTPLITFRTPGGMPASAAMSASSIAVSGVCSDGLRTTLLPVASAGARLFDAIIIGWLNDARMPTTPSGNRLV
jgi:hypothetical protein